MSDNCVLRFNNLFRILLLDFRMPKLKNNKMDADSDVISDEESRSSNEQMETNENSEVTR